jgi:hypothetical protein
MKMNKNTDVLDVLNQIKKVDAPPFLLTRIKQKIEASRPEKFSKSLSWSLSVSLAFVLGLNIMTIIHNRTSIKQENSIVQTMDMLPHNSIY